jgi:hypothetical protein
MQGKKENTLRIIDATNNQLPQDRESLFWMNVKAIPSMDKSKLSDNTPAGDYQPHQALLPPGKTGAAAGSGGGKADLSPQRIVADADESHPLLPDGDRTERRNAHSGKRAGAADG